LKMKKTLKSLFLRTVITRRKINSPAPLIDINPSQINPPQNSSLSKTKFPNFNQNL
jgi:hypothetical protein